MKSDNKNRRSWFTGKCYGIYVLTLLFVFISGCCAKREIKSFYEAYYNAMVWPENFDAYAQSHDFNKDFFSCLGEARDEISKIVQERAEICDMHVDPEWRAQCYEEIDEIALLTAINSIEAVTRHGTPFEETATGFALLLVKQVFGAEEYEQLPMQTVPQLEGYFTCKRCKKYIFF